jgi:hypothetical protein
MPLVRRITLGGVVLASIVLLGTTQAITAGATPVPPSTSSCTYSDTSQSIVSSSSSALVGVAPGDVLSVSCTGLPASTSVVVDEQSPLAAVVSPSSLAVDERDAVGAGTGTTDTSGTLSATTFTLPTNGSSGSGFVAPDPNAACPPSQAQVDAGLLACTLVVSNAATGVPLDQAVLVYVTGEPSPAPPTLALTPGAAANGDSVQVSDVSGSSGHWWAEATMSEPIPASAILVGSTPALSSTVTVSPATYTVPLGTSSTPIWTSAVLTPPAISGSFVVPHGLPGGSASVSVFEADSGGVFPGNSTNSSFPGDLTASASLSVIDTAQATVSTDMATAVDGTALMVTGSGWDPQGGSVTVEFSQTATEPFSTIGTDHATAAVQPNGAFATVLVVGPSETSGLTGPDAVYVVAAQQAVAGGSPATIEAGTPLTLEVGCTTGTAAGATCNLLVSLSAQVQGSLLSMAELPVAGNPNATEVAFSSTTLSGQFSDATGQLNTVLVNDDRGTLAGWSVTGQLEGPFQNAAPVGPSWDNQIPADYLTWTPSVSLATSGSTPSNNGATPGCPSGPSGPCPGPSGSLSGVSAGPEATLQDSSGVPVTLCSAASGAGGGSFDCAAPLLLAIPPQIAAGTYQAVLDLVLIGM